MTGLAHQHAVALARPFSELPTFPFGVMAEAGEHGAQVGGVDRDLGHLYPEALAPAPAHQTPAVERMRSAPARDPRAADQVFGPVHLTGELAV